MCCIIPGLACIGPAGYRSLCVKDERSEQEEPAVFSGPDPTVPGLARVWAGPSCHSRLEHAPFSSGGSRLLGPINQISGRLHSPRGGTGAQRRSVHNP